MGHSRDNGRCISRLMDVGTAMALGGAGDCAGAAAARAGAADDDLPRGGAQHFLHAAAGGGARIAAAAAAARSLGAAALVDAAARRVGVDARAGLAGDDPPRSRPAPRDAARRRRARLVGIPDHAASRELDPVRDDHTTGRTAVARLAVCGRCEACARAVDRNNHRQPGGDLPRHRRCFLPQWRTMARPAARRRHTPRRERLRHHRCVRGSHRLRLDSITMARRGPFGFASRSSCGARDQLGRRVDVGLTHRVRVRSARHAAARLRAAAREPAHGRGGARYLIAAGRRRCRRARADWRGRSRGPLPISGRAAATAPWPRG